MMLLNTWTKSIILIAVVVTLFKPTTAGFRSFMKKLDEELSGGCKYTSCDRHPHCPTGYDTLAKSNDDCSFFKERKYCCRRGQGPQCFFTGCDKRTSCPRHYYEIDRTKNGCLSTHDNTYFCKSTDLPPCFDLSCPAATEPPKHCPEDYNEVSRIRGRLGGCDSDFAERVTCCFPGFEIGVNGTQIINITTGYNGAQGVNVTTGGTQGVNITTGYNGTQDFNVRTGYNGTQGVNITTGYNGTQGVNITTGYNGTQGVNLNDSAPISYNRTRMVMENGHIVVVKPKSNYNGSLWDALFGDSYSSFGAFSHTLLIFPILLVLSAFKSASLFRLRQYYGAAGLPL